VRSVFWRCHGVRFTAVLWITFFIFSALRAEGQDAASTIKSTDTNEVVHALCGKSVALLGEPPVHSFGNTLDFKVQLVRRLVEECHFNALFIESGIYDYIHIDQALSYGQDVSDSMISAAIGGLWANKEMQALVPFLTEKVKAGSLTLGGLDDQLGTGTWASHEMSSDLVQPLEPGESARCASILRRHMLWQYTDEAPYGPADKENIVGCLTEIQAQLASAKQKTKSVDQSAVMLDSLQRNLARDFTEDDFTKKAQVLKWDNDRDRSMFLNYEWLRSQLPAKSKIIIWAATVHTAKDLSGIQGSEGRVSFGSYIHQELKDKAFSLGSPPTLVSMRLSVNR
jgi:erythromycin esterase-like protein